MDLLSQLLELMGLGSGAGCGRNVAAVVTGYGEDWKGGSSSGKEVERGRLLSMLLQAVYFESLSCQLSELMGLRSGTGCDRFVDAFFSDHGEGIGRERIQW